MFLWAITIQIYQYFQYDKSLCLLHVLPQEAKWRKAIRFIFNGLWEPCKDCVVPLESTGGAYACD